MSKITVVIPCYNASATIQSCLTSLESQDYDDYTVIAVDDGSTDNTAELVQSFPWCRLITNAGNRGPSHARNLGVLNAEGDLIVFLDSDCVVDDRSCLSRHARAHAQPGTWVVGGGIRGFGRGLVARADCYRWFMAIPSSSRGVWGELGKYFYTHVLSANMSVKKTVFSEIGYFDEDLWTGEDVDFCERVLRAGLDVVFDGSIVVGHQDRARLRDYLHRWFETGLDRVRVRGERKYRFHWVFPRGKASSIALCVPLAVLLTIQTVGAWWPYDKRVVWHVPLIFLGKLAMTWGMVACFFRRTRVGSRQTRHA